jgi:hypothetical protein
MFVVEVNFGVAFVRIMLKAFVGIKPTVSPFPNVS